MKMASRANQTAAIDILYPVRDGHTNEELRYSLRTLQTHYPHHGHVWIVGYQPAWVTNTHFIPGNTSKYRHAQLYNNLRIFAQHPDTPDDFIIFNDDFFLTQPISEIPVLHRELLIDQLALPRIKANPNGWWCRSLTTTLLCLQVAGYANPLSYELHVPFPANKTRLAETLEKFADTTPDNPPQWRTLYGNMHHIGGQPGTDCKRTLAGDVSEPFHSTDDTSWRRYYQSWFRRHYPNPSRYEKTP